MAYMAFDLADSTVDAAPVDAFGRRATGFTQTEWVVIRLARRERLGGLRPGSRLERLARRLFGLEPATQLANPRLEALRRAAIRCRQDTGTFGRAEMEVLLDVGFGFDQVALLASHARSEVR